MSRFTYQIATMGCKANLTDSQALEYRLQEMGGLPDQTTSPDLYILNTCTVTDNADREAEVLLRQSLGKHTMVTGCLAEVDSERLVAAAKRLGKNFLIARNSGKSTVQTVLSDWLESQKKSPMVHSGDRADWHRGADLQIGAAAIGTKASEHRTRAFIKVQDGCNAFCSYCIIPYARGRSRSISKEAICAEVNDLEKKGIREVVLTAIHAADYADPNSAAAFGFADLVFYLLENTTMPRIRLTSLDPAEIPLELIQRMAIEPRLCPHFHISLQSASSSVLARMKRAYSQIEAKNCLEKIQHYIPHAFVGMDMIAGFPGESAEEHADTMSFLKAMPWSKLHVFPFSERRGTHAAKLIESGLAVPSHIIHRRARELRQLSQERYEQQMAQKNGTVMEVLVEAKKIAKAGREYSFGYSRSYCKVLLDGDFLPNQIVRTKITGHDALALLGEAV